MHPALRRYVEPPKIHTRRYVLGGALTGLLAVLIAFTVVGIVGVHPANESRHPTTESQGR